MYVTALRAARTAATEQLLYKLPWKTARSYYARAVLLLCALMLDRFRPTRCTLGSTCSSPHPPRFASPALLRVASRCWRVRGFRVEVSGVWSSGSGVGAGRCGGW